jgi:hypothetical protein
MAKIDVNDLKDLRNDWEATASDTAETLEVVLDRSTQIKLEAKKLIQDFTNSKYALSKVTDRVINEHTSALAGLKDIHTSLHKVQELSEHFRATLLPSDLECLNDGKSLWDENSTTFMGDIDTIAVLQTNTDKERELFYIFKKALTHWSYIRANNQQMESYEKYITNQVFGFNRLDTLVQKLENIKANELFGDLRDDSTMNKDDKDSGFNQDDLDEDGFESIKSTRKKRGRRKPLGSRLSKVKE